MVSVIVPVYNAEKYIVRCVESVLAQTMPDFELILIDDGSIDRSGEICEELGVKDKRIKVVHQQNKGANMARRNGWRVAKREWVSFVDADDYIPSNALASLLSEADENTDIVLGWMSTFKTSDKTIAIEEYRRRLIGCHSIDWGPYARLFRSKLYDDFVFDIPREIKIGEDNLMNIRLAFRTDKQVKVVHREVYVYDKTNSGSLIHNFTTNTDYEELFQRHRLLSIPICYRLQYEQTMLGIRIYRLLCIIKQNWQSRNWVKSAYGKSVREDILRLNYPLNKSTRHLLFSPNILSQCIWALYSKIVQTIINIQ